MGYPWLVVTLPCPYETHRIFTNPTGTVDHCWAPGSPPSAAINAAATTATTTTITTTLLDEN